MQRARTNAAANPSTAAAQRDVYLMLDRLAAVTGHPDHPNLGDAAAEATLLAEAVATAERVSAADPKDMRARRDLAEMNASHAGALREFAPQRARETYQRVLDMYAGMPESMTASPTVRRWLSQHRRNLGISLARAGQPQAAIVELERALAEITPLEMPIDTGITLTELATVRLAQGDERGARSDMERAIGMLEGVWQDTRADVNVRRRMAAAYGLMSQIDARAGACEAARNWAQKRATLWQEIVNTDAAVFAAAEMKRIVPPRCGS